MKIMRSDILHENHEYIIHVTILDSKEKIIKGNSKEEVFEKYNKLRGDVLKNDYIS